VLVIDLIDASFGFAPAALLRNWFKMFTRAPAAGGLLLVARGLSNTSANANATATNPSRSVAPNPPISRDTASTTDNLLVGGLSGVRF